MLTVREINESIYPRAKEIGEELRSYGVDNTPYVSGPLAPEVATLSLRSRYNLGFWPGVADISIKGDKSLRQAIMTIDESKRSFERQYRFRVRTTQDTAMIKEMAKSRFPVTVPGAKISNVKIISEQAIKGWDTSKMVTVSAKLTAPAQKNVFLTGYDETAMFVAPLPETVGSVKLAHKLLRPKGISSKAIRQGEWFMSKATPAQLVEIEKLLAKGHKIRPYSLNNTTHVVRGIPKIITSGRKQYNDHGSRHGYYYNTMSIDPNNVYVTQTIRDNRSGRHKKLELEGWYTVTRNNELTVDPLAASQRGFAQTRRYYD